MAYKGSVFIAALCVSSALAAATLSSGPSIPIRRSNSRRPRIVDSAWLKSAREGLLAKYGVPPPLDSNLTRRQDATGSVDLISAGSDVAYFAPLTIGTPPVSYNVILDTGSSDLWLADASCATGCAGVAKQYAASGSTTFNNTGSIPFGIRYVGGSVNGSTAHETVSMAGFTVQGQAYGVVTSFEGNALPSAVSGIMGMAWGRLAKIGVPWWENTATQANKWKEPLFAFRLARGNADEPGTADEPGGSLTLGTVDPTLFVGEIEYTNIPDRYQSWWLIPIQEVAVQGRRLLVQGTLAAIDTGTTLIGGPPDAVEAIYSVIPGSIPAPDDSGFYYYPCAVEVNISLNFGGRSWPIDPQDFPLRTNDPDYCVGSFFAVPFRQPVPNSISPQWIIGDSFLKNVYSVYRYSPPSVGFAQLSGVTTGMTFNGVGITGTASAASQTGIIASSGSPSPYYQLTSTVVVVVSATPTATPLNNPGGFGPGTPATSITSLPTGLNRQQNGSSRRAGGMGLGAGIVVMLAMLVVR